MVFGSGFFSNGRRNTFSSFSSGIYYRDDNERSVGRLVTASAFVLISGGLAIGFAQLVSRYGWNGALNYVWEGDPYPNLRDHLNALNRVEKTLDKEDRQLNRLEEALERARLDSIDDAAADNDASIHAQWEANVKKDLHKQLARLSYDLDRWAAQIDEIPGIEQGNVNLKLQKKSLSTKVVRLMERADVLIAFHDQVKNT